MIENFIKENIIMIKIIIIWIIWSLVKYFKEVKEWKTQVKTKKAFFLLASFNIFVWWFSAFLFWLFVQSYNIETNITFAIAWVVWIISKDLIEIIEKEWLNFIKNIWNNKNTKK